MRADPRTYRQIAEQDFGILMCSSAEGCRAKLSISAHSRGKVDRANVIHLEMADNRVKRTGMRLFLTLVARATHLDWAKLPVWERLYRENAWAFKTAQRRYKTRIRAEESFTDREKAERAARRAGVSLRMTNFLLYQWVRHERVYTRRIAK